ncbi:MAG: ParB N-terminal domain-containing protein [Desulfobacteraceae bacterium]|nr:ParB N-terminal domain-containing protein [Desulfobacteraceae bacterium]
MDTDTIEKHNQTLKEVSRAMFGRNAELMIIDPKRLTLLTKNARYFKKDTFKQLVENIKKDQRLSSTPLCRRTKTEKIEVLSGNHRIKAAIEAGIPTVLIILLAEELTKDQQIAIQLSHNAIVGEDDPNLLKELWQTIEDIESRLYAGLSSDLVKEVENVKLVSFTTPNVFTKAVTFAFTDIEEQNLEAVITELQTAATGTTYLAPMAQFDRFFQMLLKIKKIENIKNGSMAMLKVVEIVQQAIRNGDQS